jgi:surface protein
MITKQDLTLKILNNEDISAIDYSHITDMSHMFFNCTSLRKVRHLDTSKVTNMDCMFNGCSSLEDISENFPLYDWAETGSKILEQNYPEYFM